MEPMSGTRFRVQAGNEKLEIEFVVGKDGSVNEFILFRDGDAIPVQRKH
jgi:hypothetical protein